MTTSKQHKSNDIAPAAALYAMRRDPISFFSKLVRDQGDVARFRLGGDHEHEVFLLTHPDYIHEVLVTQDRNFTKWFAVDRTKEILGDGLFVSEGETHMTQRRLSQPAFHRERIASYVDQMTKLSLRLRERWKPGAIVDVCREMNWLAMMIVASTMFGTDVESDAEAVRSSIDDLLEWLERSVIPTADREDYDRARSRLDDVVYRIIRDRRASGEDRGDLLSMLLHHVENEDEKMDDLQLRDEAMTFFLAGHETSANAMAWSWYLLSKHPHAEAQFHAEIGKVLDQRIAGIDDFAQLEFTGRVFAETLRLYPPLWAIGRRAISDCRIGEHFFPKGSVIILSQYITQRDSRWFPDPEKFDPDRWLAGGRTNRPKFSYFPFSSGSRSCLGEVFATVEGVICLAPLGQKWKLTFVPDQKIELRPQLTLRARHGIKMRVEPRC